MGIIRYKDVPYGGGGSSVTPNPSGTATANLEKVQIESTVYAIKDSNAVHGSDKGTANGVASLDANGKVPSAQLPSYVDDVIEGYYDTVTDRFYEESTFTTVIPPEDGKSWVDVSSNKSYRWTGSVYVRVDEGVQLGETSNTAYRGDRGKTAYDHATESGKISTAVASGLYKIAATAEGHIASLTAAVKADFTALGLADASLYLPLAGGEMTGAINTYEPVQDIMAAIQPKTAYYGSIGASARPYRFGYFQGAVLGGSGGTGGAGAKLGTLSMYTGSGAKYAMITPDSNQSGNEVDLVLPKASGTLALTSEIPTKTSDLTNDSGYITSYTDTTYTLSRDGYYIKLTSSSGSVQSITLDSLLAALPAWTGNPTDDTYLIRETTSGDGTFGRVKFSTVWSYISGKLGSNSLAFINKTSNTSKFLREDGTWQTVTASWSGGQVTSNIYPNATNTLNLGLPTRYFKESYAVTAFSDNFVAGYPSGVTGKLSFCRADSGYGVNITPPSLSANVDLTLPSASGTLLTDKTGFPKTPTKLLETATKSWNQYTVSNMSNYSFICLTAWKSNVACHGSTIIDFNTFKTNFTNASAPLGCGVFTSDNYMVWIYYSSDTKLYVYVGANVNKAVIYMY